MEANVYNIKGEKTGSIELSKGVFEAKINIPLMHEITVWYLANKRQGTHSAKTRAEVSGSGKKPWKQKGTGRARAGSIRSPLWRHGGVIFAKKPREFSYSMPAKKVRLALLSSLSAKAKDGDVVVFEEVTVEQPKTKNVAAILKNLSGVLGKRFNKAIFVLKADKNLRIASRNIGGLKLMDVRELNAYDVLNTDKVIFTKESLGRVEGELAGNRAEA
jgi:large subunit ribosomal protein L4